MVSKRYVYIFNLYLIKSLVVSISTSNHMYIFRICEDIEYENYLSNAIAEKIRGRPASLEPFKKPAQSENVDCNSKMFKLLYPVEGKS